MPWRDAGKVWEFVDPPKKQRDQVVAAVKRKAKPRFYADENFPPLAVQILKDHGARVATAQDENLVGHPDEDHAAFALKHGCVLITCDRDYLNNKRFPLIRCPAIFVFDFGSSSRAEILMTFPCLGDVFRMPEFFDKWVKIDASREGWIQHQRFLDGTTSRSRFRVSQGKLETWVDERVR